MAEQLTYEGLRARLKATFGDPGENALETSDIGEEDLEQGFEHCVQMIAPALEEEMFADGSLERPAVGRRRR